MSADEAQDGSSKCETVVATSYVPQGQYERWENEAAKRNQSVSSWIASMVETGFRNIQIEEESPDEIGDLRRRLRQLRNERDELQQRMNAQQQQEYQVGLGKIKDLIIENPGLNRKEIMNHVNANTVIFVDEFLDHLENSEFVKDDGDWYPPEEVDER
jgi:hypothetical protein